MSASMNGSKLRGAIVISVAMTAPVWFAVSATFPVNVMIGMGPCFGPRLRGSVPN